MVYIMEKKREDIIVKTFQDQVMDTGTSGYTKTMDNSIIISKNKMFYVVFSNSGKLVVKFKG